MRFNTSSNVSNNPTIAGIFVDEEGMSLVMPQENLNVKLRAEAHWSGRDMLFHES